MDEPSGSATAVTLASDLGFVEGPVLTQDGGLLVVSLDHQRLYGLGEGVKTLAEFDAAPNGATQAADGTIYLAAFSGNWPARDDCTGQGGVYAWRANGDVALVTTDPTAPNDLCFGPDGLLYVTDPNRGNNGGRIWRVDVETGDAELLADVDWYPNGIGFDASDALWLADTRGQRMMRLPVDGASTSPAVEAFPLQAGKPDGFAFDTDGHVVVAAPGTPEHPDSSVQVWTTDGELLDLLLDGGSTYFTNIAIDADGTAYVTEAQHGRVLRLDGVCAGGLPLYPFRNDERTNS